MIRRYIQGVDTPNQKGRRIQMDSRVRELFSNPEKIPSGIANTTIP